MNHLDYMEKTDSLKSQQNDKKKLNKKCYNQIQNVNLLVNQNIDMKTNSMIVLDHPELPSDPRMKWWISGPEDIRGTWHDFSSTPFGVTSFTCTTWGQIGGVCYNKLELQQFILKIICKPLYRYVVILRASILAF